MSDNADAIYVTSQHVADYLSCPTKCYLRHTGQKQEASPYAEWLLHQSRHYKAKAEQRLLQQYSPVDVTRDNITMNGWKLAVGIDCSGGKYRSIIDAAKQEKFLYPIRFVAANKPSKEDRLLLAFDALVLSQALKTNVDSGEMIYGDSFQARKVNVASLLGETRKTVRNISKMLADSTPPKLSLNKHCPAYVFNGRCHQQAKQQDDLSLLASLSEKEKAKLNSKGIFTVTQLSYTFRPRRRSKRSADRAEKYHHSLKALAMRENKIHVIGNPALEISGTRIFIDVEGIPDRDFYYLIGIRIESAEKIDAHSFWADSQAHERDMWHQFISVLSKWENATLIHYGSYESTFFRRMIERYGCDETLAERLTNDSVNLLSKIYAKVYFPGYTNGLKEIAGYLGFAWNADAPSGLHSVVWRQQWEESGNPALKNKLIRYNSDDCEALSLITDSITRLSDPEIERPDSVVDASTLKPSHAARLGHFKSDIAHFENINNAARWDYQRDRIYVRSGIKLKSKTKAFPKKRKKESRVEMVIKWPAVRKCPKCGKQYPEKEKVLTQTMHELLFGRDSMKRRLVKYEFQIYRCRSCGNRYGIDPRFGHHTRKYGWNVLSYFIFNTIELCVSQNTVVRNLNDMLGFDLHRSNVGNMKVRAARYYRETRDKILEKILSGAIIHVDETKANIQGKRAYVWALTNMKEVVFLLTESREGEFIQELLSNYKGILISDFYSAYDSIDCEQQKCLVHIMRDLNDEVLKNPFDEEFKKLANAFADLLRPMIETIDRHGLKKHFLNKHLKDVEGFYIALETAEYKSELVNKYKKRFIKNRDKLFTFLKHDGVPWNNNNAEHAIKAFAILRNVISGPSTKGGTEDYLLLLSICRTCEYHGISFFDFLRSGEKDIDAYVTGKHTALH
ncbi:MAG: IS66 family transposase [Hyphomicrobiales bacterium]|nr:IS66 family transposase [Hyphomicrobiales bacterium]